jgi:hypothetical protein
MYSSACSGLTDIVSGSNPGCGTDGKLIGLWYEAMDCSHSLFTSIGFPASKGWDPVSIQDEIRASNFLITLHSFFTGYWTWNPELHRTAKARWIIIKFQATVMVSQRLDDI